MICSLCLVNFLEWLTELSKTFTYLYQFVTRYDKGYRLGPDEGTHRQVLGGFQVQEVLSPGSWVASLP